jgi:hypothetical protein
MPQIQCRFDTRHTFCRTRNFYWFQLTTSASSTPAHPYAMALPPFPSSPRPRRTHHHRHGSTAPHSRTTTLRTPPRWALRNPITRAPNSHRQETPAPPTKAKPLTAGIPDGRTHHAVLGIISRVCSLELSDPPSPDPLLAFSVELNRRPPPVQLKPIRGKHRNEQEH